MAGMEQQGATAIEGSVAAGFEPVREVFAASFERGDDVGATLCVYRDGRPVVDLAGGIEPGRGPYHRDTLQLVFSTTKGITTLCALMLVERGALDPDAPVASYWPEFAAAGKEAIPLRVLVSHRAGLPGLADTSDLDSELFYAVRPFVDRLAAEAPWWEPGSAFGYHALTFGYLVGEVVRRVTGSSLGTVLSAEIARPLGLDCYIGLPDDPAIAGRVARNLFPPPAPGLIEAMAGPPRPDDSLQIRCGRMLLALRDYDPRSGASFDEVYNTEAMRRTENPSANGITNASSLAKLYAAMLGEVDGLRLLSRETLELAREPQTDGLRDLLFGDEAGMRFGFGFMLPSSRHPMLGPGSFGHFGSGGSLAFGDVDRACSFAFVPNKMAGAHGEDRRAELLLDVLRDCLD